MFTSLRVYEFTSFSLTRDALHPVATALGSIYCSDKRREPSGGCAWKECERV